MIPLSKHLGVTRKKLEEVDILDVDLGIDTQFFIDPVLLRDSEIPDFSDSRDKILKYFGRIIKMVKTSHLSQQMKEKTIQMLAVKEPQGLSIGYGGKTDRGTAIPRNVAQEMIKTIVEILSVGIEDPEIVEILSMFVSGYGPDSISDLTAHIIYDDLCAYTQRQCEKLKVETSTFTINGKDYNLPKHPYNKGYILFVPASVISPLPVATDWESVQDAASFNESLRQQISEIFFPSLLDDIENIRKKSPQEINEIKERLQKLINVYTEVEVEPYNLNDDPAGYYSISPEVEKVSRYIVPTRKPKNTAELNEAIHELMDYFKKVIENNGLNKLLYRSNGTPHREEIAQILLYAVANLYCNLADIMLARESNAGRGSVDFSLGTGYQDKIIIEVKKSKNQNLFIGYEKQVEAYKKSESASHSIYLVIIVSTRKKDDQLSLVQKRYEEGLKKGETMPELYIIDGLKYPSPSKLK